MLAIVFGLQELYYYVTDHKPPTFIVKKPLSKAPKRLQDMILKTNHYSYNLLYKECTKIPIVAALSRGLIEKSETEHIKFIDNLDQTPVNKHNLLRIQEVSK